MFVFQLKQMEPVKTEAQKEQEIKQIETRLRAMDAYLVRLQGIDAHPIFSKGYTAPHQFATSIHAYFEKNKMNEFARENKFSEISNALKDICNFRDSTIPKNLPTFPIPPSIHIVISEREALENTTIAEAFLNNPKRIAWAFIEIEKNQPIADRLNELDYTDIQFKALSHKLISKAFSENPERIVQLFKNLTTEMGGLNRAHPVFAALKPIGQPSYPTGKWEATNFVLARAFLENPEKLIHDFVELSRAGVLLDLNNILKSEDIAESFVADPERLTRAFAGLAKALPTDFMVICDGINANESIAHLFSHDPQKVCDKILKVANALGSQFNNQGFFLLNRLPYAFIDYAIDKFTLDELLEKLSRALENQRRQNQK